MRYRTSDGFSLIELMIVISIISILAMMAIPSYQQYTRRARFAEVVTTANTYKIAVALAIQEGTPLQDITNGQAGIPQKPPGSKNLLNLTVINGVITATGTAAAANATYILKPSHDGSRFAVSGSCLKMGFCLS